MFIKLIRRNIVIVNLALIFIALILGVNFDVSKEAFRSPNGLYTVEVTSPGIFLTLFPIFGRDKNVLKVVSPGFPDVTVLTQEEAGGLGEGAIPLTIVFRKDSTGFIYVYEERRARLVVPFSHAERGKVTITDPNEKWVVELTKKAHGSNGW